MEKWERIAKKVKHKLPYHRCERNPKDKIVRFYREAYFTGRTRRGPLPLSEEDWEVQIDGNENKAIVRRLGFGYYRLQFAVEKTMEELRIGNIVPPSESSDRKVYSWKA